MNNDFQKYIVQAAVQREDLFVNISETDVHDHARPPLVKEDRLTLFAPVMAFFDDLDKDENGWKTGTLFAELTIDNGEWKLVDYYCNWDSGTKFCGTQW